MSVVKNFHFLLSEILLIIIFNDPKNIMINVQKPNGYFLFNYDD